MGVRTEQAQEDLHQHHFLPAEGEPQMVSHLHHELEHKPEDHDGRHSQVGDVAESGSSTSRSLPRCSCRRRWSRSALIGSPLEMSFYLINKLIRKVISDLSWIECWCVYYCLNQMQGKKEVPPQQMTPRGEKEKLNDKVKVILRVRPFV